MFNKLTYNPATAGEKDAICANMVVHRQWRGFSDGPYGIAGQPGFVSLAKVGPETQTVTLTSPVNIKIGNNKFIRNGFGVAIIDDKAGAIKATNIRGSYALKVNVGKGVVSAGADVGMVQGSIDASRWRAIDPADPNIPAQNESDRKIDIGGGVYYKNPAWKELYVGLSATHLNQPVVNFNATQFNFKPHIYMVAGAEHSLNPELTLIPSLLIKYRSVMQIEGNVSVLYQNQFRGGLAYRTLPNSDAITFMLGYHIRENLIFGYSYDLTLSRLGNFSNGTHEVMLNYCFKLKTKGPKPPIPHLSPRFLKSN